MKRAHIFVEGRVQGVGFRYYTKTNAQKIGIGGWVRNLPDGRVEAVLEGKEEDVKEMISLIREGPSSSQVRRVQTEWAAPGNEFDNFQIRR